MQADSVQLDARREVQRLIERAMIAEIAAAVGRIRGGARETVKARAGRLIDFDEDASMEAKKREGYF